MSTSSLLQHLGLSCPIIQAPMAGVSTPELAAAVSNAGGLGSLGIGASNAQQAREVIEQTQKLTDRPFNVNVFCHRPAKRDDARETAWCQHLAPLFHEFGSEPPQQLNEIYTSFLEDDAVLCVLLDLCPAVVSFHFGVPPAAIITALREVGAVTLATATSVDEAKQIERAGVDGIIAQGFEAGGHRGMFEPLAADEQLGTLALVQLLKKHTKLPLIAAGGIMDGAAMKASLAAGAIAAQLGTAFVLCPESAANQGYRDTLASQRAASTTMTTAISGRPARGIVNRLTQAGAAPDCPVPADYPLAYDVAKQLNGVAANHGSVEFAAHWAGQNAAKARALPAAQLIAMLKQEFERA